MEWRVELVDGSKFEKIEATVAEVDEAVRQDHSFIVLERLYVARAQVRAIYPEKWIYGDDDLEEES